MPPEPPAKIDLIKSLASLGLASPVYNYLGILFIGSAFSVDTLLIWY